MIEILISSTVLILIIYGIRTFWRGKINVHLQYALWLLVVIRLFPIGLIAEANIPIVESPISIMRSFNHLYTNLSKSDTNVATQSKNQVNETNDNSDEISTSTENSNSATTNPPSPQSTGNKLNVTLIKTIATTVWYIGMVISALWMLYVNIHYQRLIKKDRTLLRSVTCKLPVYVSTNIHSPMLLMINGKFGIYVTKACVDDELKMKHALTHELCHYKHLDYLWSFIRCIILIAYWFNPFVWLAAVLSKRDCELSCDAAALKILGEEERFSYGRTILEFVSVHNKRSNILNIATGMSEGKLGMKERIQRISKKSKMMLGTCITILIIIVIAIVTTFTTAPKDTNDVSINEDYTIKEDISITTEDDTTDSSKLSDLLDVEKQTEGFNNGFYFDGEQLMTPDGPIESLSDFADDTIIHKYYGKCVWDEVDVVRDDGFSKSFSRLLGVSYWITMNATKETSITIDYSTTASNTTLKTIVVLPDETIIELKNNESNTITIPQGKSEITIVSFDAAGEVNVSFSNLTDAVSIEKKY